MPEEGVDYNVHGAALHGLPCSGEADAWAGVRAGRAYELPAAAASSRLRRAGLAGLARPPLLPVWHRRHAGSFRLQRRKASDPRALVWQLRQKRQACPGLTRVKLLNSSCTVSRSPQRNHLADFDTRNGQAPKRPHPSQELPKTVPSTLEEDQSQESGVEGASFPGSLRAPSESWSVLHQSFAFNFVKTLL